MSRSFPLFLVVFAIGCSSEETTPEAVTTDGAIDDTSVAEVAPATDTAGNDSAAVDSGTTDTATSTADSAATDASATDAGSGDAASATDTRPGETSSGDGGPVACTDVGGKTFAGNGHCYFPLPTTRTLVSSATECKNVGAAHIVTITSAAENDFVKTVGTSERWIGMTATNPSNMKADYDWLGGEAVTYDGWNTGSPASLGRCAVQLSTGPWEDRPCSDLKIAICERE